MSEEEHEPGIIWPEPAEDPDEEPSHPGAKDDEREDKKE